MFDAECARSVRPVLCSASNHASVWLHDKFGVMASGVCFGLLRCCLPRRRVEAQCRLRGSDRFDALPKVVGTESRGHNVERGKEPCTHFRQAFRIWACHQRTTRLSGRRFSDQRRQRRRPIPPTRHRQSPNTRQNAVRAGSQAIRQVRRPPHRRSRSPPARPEMCRRWQHILEDGTPRGQENGR